MTATEFMNDPQFKRLPRIVAAYARAGWFEGGVFFLISGTYTHINHFFPPMPHLHLHLSFPLFLSLAKTKQQITALTNYGWSQNPTLLRDPINKAIAALTTCIYWGAGLWYAKNGIKSTSGVLAVIGSLQVWSAFVAS